MQAFENDTDKMNYFEPCSCWWIRWWFWRQWPHWASWTSGDTWRLLRGSKVCNSGCSRTNWASNRWGYQWWLEFARICIPMNVWSTFEVCDQRSSYSVWPGDKSPLRWKSGFLTAARLFLNYFAASFFSSSSRRFTICWNSLIFVHELLVELT